MNRISTAASYQSALLNIMNAQSRQQTAQNQVSTGKKATDLQGFGNQAVALTAANSLKARTDSHLENAKALSGALAVQNGALSQMASAVQGARGAIAEALATGNADGLMESLQGQFSQMTDALNTRYQGDYLFAGGQTQTPPVAASTLADIAAAPTVPGMFANDQLQTSQRVDDNTVLNTGFLADSLGTPAFTALKAVQQLDTGPSGPLTGKLTAAQTTQLQSMLASFDAAYNGLNDQVAKNGGMQNRVDASISTLTDRQVTMESVVGDIANVDGAEAVSRLQLAQVALQASAQVFATLNNTSLLNVLSQ